MAFFTYRDPRLSAANSKVAEHATLENPNAAGITRLVTDSAEALTAKATGDLQARVAELEAELAESKKNGEAFLGQLGSRTIRDEVRQAPRASHVREEAIADALTMGGLELEARGRARADRRWPRRGRMAGRSEGLVPILVAARVRCWCTWKPR
jgi:hypothetical protein